MESPALISVIIPTRNRLGFLRESVASVRAQSFVDWELIVVDDCSQDGTWDWLQSLDDARIRVLRMDQHKERSAARNAALRMANGEYVLFLDDDDWLLDGALADLFEALQEHDDAIAAVGARVQVDSDLWVRTPPHPRRRHTRNAWSDALLGWSPWNGRALLRLCAVRRAGGWNEAISLSEDYELWLRLVRIGPVVLIPQTVMACRIHPGQTLRDGAWPLNIRLGRAAVAGLGAEEAEWANRNIRFRRFACAATYAYLRGRYRLAISLLRRAVRSAPWILWSPVNRGDLTRLGWRCLIGVGLGRRGIVRLHRAKRTWMYVMQRRRQRSSRGSEPALFR